MIQPVSPLFPENDHRLIVYEQKHPMIKPLEEHSKGATKEKIISQLSQTMPMIGIANKNIKKQYLTRKRKFNAHQ